MTRLNKANDIIELAILMQNSYTGLTIDEIAQKFECCRRSAERMKAVLVEKFGNKIEEVTNTTDNKKRWRFKKGTMNYLINFSSTDFANLEQCKKIFKTSAKQKEIEELIQKIKALNPENISNIDVEEILASQSYAVAQGFKEKINLETLQIINEAILSQKQIKMKYNKDNFDIIIEPYGIIYWEKAYLIAFNPYANEIWTYRISKIKDITLTDKYYDKDENFNMKDYTNQSFGIYHNKILDVVLEFDNSVKDDILEYYFHPTQIVNELKNGNIEVKFKASGSFEIITELLKWRNTVKIISPQCLKDEYIKEIKAMYENIKE